LVTLLPQKPHQAPHCIAGKPNTWQLSDIGADERIQLSIERRQSPFFL
jgi:hypothetical protein